MSRITELEEKAKELMKEIETLKQEKIEEFEYNFENFESYLTIGSGGDVNQAMWTNHDLDFERYSQGNVFQTKEEAEREVNKRALLTRFRQFRDQCNGDWKPNFKIFMANKYNIGVDFFSGGLEARDSGNICELCLFGYFKNKEDCDRAIELFGDEIKRLYLEW